MSRGFYLISDFHVDMNKLANPSYADGTMLIEPSRRARVESIFNWLCMTSNRIVAFVGDTGNSAELAVLPWTECAMHLRRVLVMTGNHEYYSPRMRPMSEIDARIKTLLVGQPNITLMEPGTTYIEDGTLFLGCTGWYNWDAIPEDDLRAERFMWERFSNDFRMPIYDIGYPDILARRHADWLIEQVGLAQDNDAIKRIVLLTHTAPRPDLLAGPDHDWYLLNGSYCNTFMLEVPPVDVKKKIRVWGYGHSHFHEDRIVDGIRYVNHARGYQGEKYGANSLWKPKWIDLEDPLTSPDDSDSLSSA